MLRDDSRWWKRMIERIVSEEFYYRLKKEIEKFLGEKNKFGPIIHDVVSSGRYYYPNGAVDCFALIQDIDKKILEEKEAFHSACCDAYRHVGPDRTIETFFEIQQENRYNLIPAMIILCARDLFNKNGSCNYDDLAYYARRELILCDIDPFFLGQAKWYLDSGWSIKFMEYLEEEYDESIEKLAKIALDELIKNNDSFILAKFFTAYYLFNLGDRKRIIFYHEPFHSNRYSFEKEFCKIERMRLFGIEG